MIVALEHSKTELEHFLTIIYWRWFSPVQTRKLSLFLQRRFHLSILVLDPKNLRAILSQKSYL
jgi:hypothetical protein